LPPLKKAKQNMKRKSNADTANQFVETATTK
jgi:hypothetical protein